MLCFSVLSKKKARRIVVNELEYFWVATGQNGYLDLFVERNIPSSPKLTCVFDYHTEQIRGAKQVAITPSVARRAIVRARELGWNPDAPGKDLRLKPDEHKLDIGRDRIRHFYKVYEALKPALHPGYEHILDDLVDIEVIADNLWSANPGDEFWRAAIDVLGLHFGQDTTQFESRLAGAHAVEVQDGLVGAYRSPKGELIGWAQPIATIAQPDVRGYVELGANDARIFAEGLRKLASLPKLADATSTTSEWLPTRGDVYLELPALPASRHLRTARRDPRHTPHRTQPRHPCRISIATVAPMPKNRPVIAINLQSAERSPTETVEAFLAALAALDMDGARALMADDIVYQNVPFPADRSAEATMRTLKRFLVPFRTFEVETLNIAANGNTVLTERIDTFANGKYRAGFWVCGTFEVEGGKITLWRDRFDMADMTFSLVGGLLRAPFR